MPTCGCSLHAVYCLQNLLVVGEASRYFFRKDFLSIHKNFKSAAPGFDELSFDSELIFNRLRQTGGLRGVVSGHAIFDFDLHLRVSPELNCRHGMQDSHV